jgi:hypothetical protein
MDRFRRETSAMLFGKYLVERGIINADEFFQAFKAQLASRPQLGTLAVQRRLLTIHQVFEVLEAQCDRPSELFGDLAVQMGFITNDDVARLLREQSDLIKPFKDVIVELEILDRTQVEVYHREFTAGMEHATSAEMAMNSA